MHGSGGTGEVGSGDNADSLGSEAYRRELAATLSLLLDSGSSHEEIRACVRPICAQARRERLAAAELLKLIKESAAAVFHKPASKRASERQQTLDRIISVCIDEYYAAG